MADSNDGGASRGWLVQGVVGAGLPVLGYVVAFVYELGYCTVFKLPDAAISLDMIAVLRAVFWTASGLGGVAFLANVVTAFGGEKPYERRVFMTGAVAVGTLPLVVWGAPIAPRASSWLLGFFLLGLFQIWLRPLIRATNTKGYRNKLIADDVRMRAEDRKGNDGVPMVQRALYSGHPGALLAVGVAWILFAAYGLGANEARKQWEFYVIPGAPEQVVLRIYGDKMITAPFDRRHWKLGKRIELRQLGDDKPLPLHLENLGALKPPQ